MDRFDTLLFDSWAKWFGKKIHENRVPLISSLVVGFLSHMFAFTNKLVNHDEVYNLFAKGATLTSGRWGLGMIDSIFPNYSMPWIYGVITIILMAVSVCFIVRTFQIHNKVLQALLAGTILAFPSLIGTMAFMFTAPPYGLSFLLAVIAVWLLQKNTIKWFLPALACMVFSLSIYQAYIAIAASFLVLILIQQLLHEEKVISILRRGLCFLVFLILSLGLYYAAAQLINLLKGIQFNGYANDNISFSLASIPSDIAVAYRAFFRNFQDHFVGIMPTLSARRLHFCLLAAVAVLFLVWGLTRKTKQIGSLLLLAALVAILPLAVNCMYLFTTEGAVHTLVLYSFIAVYILAAIVADVCIPLFVSFKLMEYSRRIAVHLVPLALAFILVTNVYIANEAYLNLYLRYENTYAFYTSLIADIKMMPTFDKDTKLAVIGTYREPDYYWNKFDFLYFINGTTYINPDFYPKDRFLEYYLGFDISLASAEEMEAIQSSQEFAEMPCYPYSGSMKMVGDIFVVKLSD